ncbi:MAG: L-sorbose 1-phosphate reductase [Ruminococcaceae bacterium]|nr:L-sorbose 1-phosphate reductase [Oscillospiraceae bacterium]
MKTKAVRLYGENDLRLEEFDLPELKNGEILIKIISDSVCMSTYKTAKQGAKHLRVPDNVAENPIIIGHEFCAEVVEVTDKWKDKFSVGDKVVMPPVLAYLGGPETVGYSFCEIGGVSTYSIVYEHIIENDFLIKVDSDCFFKGSLIEPASCVIRGYKANLHLDDNLKPYTNIRPKGKVAILAGCGPMGLVAIDIALHGDIKPSLLVVTDINEEKLERAKQIFSPEDAKKDGIELIFTKSTDKDELISLTNNDGYDDVFVYAPVPSVVELGNSILGFDGCLNFFAGPLDKNFSANFNFYNVHYKQHHIAGTSGSTTEDMHDIVRLISEKRIDPAVMITHIGGIDAAIDTTLHLPEIEGGKKLIYTHINLPLTAIEDFQKLKSQDKRFVVLYELVKQNKGLWSMEAEKYLLDNFK